MVRPVRIVVTIAAVAIVASAGMPPLIATTVAAPLQRGWTVIVNQEIPVGSNGLSGLDAVAKLREMRGKYLVDRYSSNPKVARMAQRSLQRLDILDAKTDVERHERIQKLPVTIVRSVPTDGRVGIVKSFIAGGKERARVFFPASFAPTSSDLPDSRPPRGPAPRSAATEEEVCTDNDLGPCVEDWEMEDFAMVLADSQAEYDYQQSQYDQIYSVWNGHQPACEVTPPSGPSADAPLRINCIEYAVAAVGSLGGFVSSIASEWGLMGRAVSTLTKLGRARFISVTAGLVSLAFVTGYAVGSFGVCVYEQLASPVAALDASGRVQSFDRWCGLPGHRGFDLA